MSCAVHAGGAGSGILNRDSDVSRQRTLGAKQARSVVAWAWAPNSNKRARTDAGASREFMERTSRLYEELETEAHARLAEWNMAEAAKRAESRRIAELYPIHFAELQHTPKMDPKEALVAPDQMDGQSPCSPPGADTVEGTRNKTELRMLSARETPAMGPAKHASPTIDTSAFSRSLSFKPSELTLLSRGAKEGTPSPEPLPDLTLPPAAMSAK